MMIETNLRYRAFQKSLSLSERLIRRIFAIRSDSPLDNLSNIVEDGLFKATIQTTGCAAFSVFHRGTKADLGVIRQIFVDEDYSLERFRQNTWVTQAYRNIVRNGELPTIIDAGSNIGLGGLYLKRLFERAKLVAVEPASSNLRVLRRNLTDGADRIVHGAIHAGRETISLMDPDEGEWGFSTHTSDNRPAASMETVDCYSFSNLLRVDETPFILKIDIEGGEKDQFEDKAFLSRFALIIIELHDWLYPGDRTSTSFLKFAAEANFDFCHRGENVFLFNRQFAAN